MPSPVLVGLVGIRDLGARVAEIQDAVSVHVGIPGHPAAGAAGLGAHGGRSVDAAGAEPTAHGPGEVDLVDPRA